MAWLISLALVLNALLPALVHARVSRDVPAALLEICSNRLDASRSAPSGEPDAPEVAGGMLPGHCALCAASGDAQLPGATRTFDFAPACAAGVAVAPISSALPALAPGQHRPRGPPLSR